MPVVGRLDQYGSMLAGEFDETTANNPSITGLGTYYAVDFNENIVDIVRNGLLLNLDAGNLVSYPGSGTTWTDLSGSGSNGTLVNGPTYSSENGGSIVFDGVNDYVALGASTNFNFSTGDFTIESWFYLTGNATLNGNNTRDACLFNCGDISGVSGAIYMALVILGNNTTTGTNFQIYKNQGGTVSLTSTGSISKNAWHQVVVSRIGTNLNFYLDASQAGSTITDSNSWGSSTNSAAIGTLFTSGPYVDAFPGYVSTLRIYKEKGLTAKEVSQNYNAIATRYSLVTTTPTAPMLANVFRPYDPVYDEFAGVLYGLGQGTFMRQNTDKSVIVYNEIDEIGFTPSYRIFSSATSVNEGSSVTFTANTTNVESQTTLYYDITGSVGIASADFSNNSLSGSLVISGTFDTGFGSTTLTVSNDATTEGTETFNMNLRTGSISGPIVATSSTITINDTSGGYRYIRWIITDLKNFSTANSVQASEFVLQNNGVDISMSGSTVTNPGGSNPVTEVPSNLKDANTGTKWLDFNIKNSPFTSTLIFDMGSTTTFNGYRWATANDAEERDPKSWTVSGSNDGTNYTTLHTVTGFTATVTRNAYQTAQSF